VSFFVFGTIGNLTIRWEGEKHFEGNATASGTFIDQAFGEHGTSRPAPPIDSNLIIFAQRSAKLRKNLQAEGLASPKGPIPPERYDGLIRLLGATWWHSRLYITAMLAAIEFEFFARFVELHISNPQLWFSLNTSLYDFPINDEQKQLLSEWGNIIPTKAEFLSESRCYILDPDVSLSFGHPQNAPPQLTGYRVSS
jgi:hypothetical protein